VTAGTWRRLIARRGPAALALAVVALALLPAPAGADAHTAVRILDVASVDPGGEVVVTVEVRGFGRYGRVSEVLPDGWTLVDSSLPEPAVTVANRTIRFLLLNLDLAESVTFWYTVRAPDTAGKYALRGVVQDSDRVSRPVGGAGEVVVRPVPQECLRGGFGGAGDPSQDARFCDVPVDAYYATPVANLHAGAVLSGTLCEEGLCPSAPVARKTLAVWMVRVLDGEDPEPVTQSRFDDVDPTGFHARFIERLAELGVTAGCGDGSGFCPDRTVSRAQAAVFLSRAYRLPDGPAPGFTDVADDAWYAADVAKLAASGITQGCDGDGRMFCPGRDTTRGQLATFLHRVQTADFSTG